MQSLCSSTMFFMYFNFSLAAGLYIVKATLWFAILGCIKCDLHGVNLNLVCLNTTHCNIKLRIHFKHMNVLK